MAESAVEGELRERLSRVERQVAESVTAMSQAEHRLARLETSPELRLRRQHPLPVVPFASELARRDAPPAGQEHQRPSLASFDGSSISDFLGGRALAWLGAIATLLGIVLLLALAVSHGWIGREARIGLAASGSALLMAAGIWLHSRRGRTEATVAMVAAATAGSFATLIVASAVYHLIPGLAAVAASLLVGGLATALAVRWAGPAVAVLGLIGGLLSPILVGAPSSGITLAILAAGAACAMWVVLWQRWSWLALAAVLVCAPQWAVWLSDEHAAAPKLLVLGVFGGLGLLGAVFAQLRSPQEDSVAHTAAALALLNAAIIGVACRLVFGVEGSSLWLAGMGLIHAAVGLSRWTRFAVHGTLRRLLVAVGVIAADAAVGLAANGLVLSVAWTAAALGFAWLLRRGEPQRPDQPWLGVGLGAHIGLVLARALIELSPGQLAAAPPLASLASMAILATACLGSARIAGSGHDRWRAALDALGLLTVGYLTAGTVEGPTLVGAWALEAVALVQIGRRTADPVAHYGGLAFLIAAASHGLAIEAPPNALVSGTDSLGASGLAMGATAFAALRAWMLVEPGRKERGALLAGAGLAIVYLASVAVVTAFQPAAGTDPGLLLDLSVREQGQVLLSALWGLVGVFGLIAGLRSNILGLRTASLGLLLLTVAKVFLYDLSTLTSIYRVVSFFVLGGLLLAGAFAYQRLRPPERPDLRSLHPSQR